MFTFDLKTSTISATANILLNPIEYLKGVGPQRADLLKKELSIFTFRDLLEHFPYRHIDKSRINVIADITPQTEYIQVAGIITSAEVVGDKRAKRLVAQLKDKTGILELAWFQGVSWIQKMVIPGQAYLVFGKVGYYGAKPQIIHPELELFSEIQSDAKKLEPVYSSTEKLKARGLGGRQIGKLTQTLLALVHERDLAENLPEKFLKMSGFPSRYTAFRQIHFPSSAGDYESALKRLKFEELFIAQIRMGLLKLNRYKFSQGVVFEKVGELFNNFYKEHLPFQLTGAQKRVIREIRADTARGHQMNRLLQGDVGSGKTIVALLTMLLAADNGFQSCLMAPTEILARQHYSGIVSLLEELPVKVGLLTGSAKSGERKKLLKELEDGSMQILIGTHAVIEDVVLFKNLGLTIIDEQHRFGVAQRARLWKKAAITPHILVMTATPIPRTLAMTAYGDLDYSVIDELPPGRQPVTTLHRYENQRSKVMDFIRGEISRGRQIYVVFPLIEESDKMDYENLMKGYENVKAYFPEPTYWISMVHGRQPLVQKETNMKRFVDGDTQIMVSTTVIEVGINVPNATVMVIESAEKFGLSQLHQLRGRVGRGGEKSYCILLTGKCGNDARERMKIMTTTNDGFVIAEKDLELRGPGEIEGTRQSGALNFRLADIVKDRFLLNESKSLAVSVLENDQELVLPENVRLKKFLLSQHEKTLWSRIS